MKQFVEIYIVIALILPTQPIVGHNAGATSKPREEKKVTDPPALNMKIKIHYDRFLKIPFDPKQEVLRRNATQLLNIADFDFQLASMYLAVKSHLLDVGYMEMSKSAIHDSTKYLTDLCKKEARHKSKGNMWYSVFITKAEFFAAGDKKPQTGTTFVGEHCSIDHSCMMLHYDQSGGHLARALARELARSLGVTRDAKSPGCKVKDFVVQSRDGWPVCSREDINMNIIKDKFFCLGDEELRRAVSIYYTPIVVPPES